jgi:hypothetical protein
MRLVRAAWLLAAMTPLSFAAPTEVLPLSGMGNDGDTPVYWDFRLDSGRGAGEWRRILVPSCWEQQGFGAYYYGTQGRGKPDDDPIIPKETGTYRRRFEIPAAWREREIHIVFEAAMTDTTVFVNGQQAGDTHQGGFYRFSYDITKLLKAGTNSLEVRVSKESANKSVNLAERRGDYWTFGGIYRPVWLEARPRHHIAWTAIDARADGSFLAQVHLNARPPKGTRLRAQIYGEDGQSEGAPFESGEITEDTVALRGSLTSPSLWTAETPRLHSVKLSLLRGKASLHELEQRFGFRTLEVRPRDGVYLNGSKIVLKGVNRHSFRPDSGRTLTRVQNYDDARLIKGANMNAVRMSHYPPDPAFLDAADELGLYVLDELAGWQGFYDSPTGARLIGQMIRRDVNHPGILFWDNGNEGGWNTDNDGEFERWDPQHRPVLHPWAIHGGINTDHYENYDSTVKLSAGPEIFMPTEFLHGLYDGGIGAGLRDYWNVMGRSPTVAGGFFWSFADEGVMRSDRDGRIDNVGNSAPDGMLGPWHEKEGSYFAVKELWSPVEASKLRLVGGKLSVELENRYDFTDLERCTLQWRRLRLPGPGERTAPSVLATGQARLPPQPPHTKRIWEKSIDAQALGANEILEAAIHGPSGEELWTWVLRPEPVAPAAHETRVAMARRGNAVESGDHRLEFDPLTGSLQRLVSHGQEIPLRGPNLVAYLREPKLRSFKPLGPGPVLRKLTLAPRNEAGMLARATYDGALREVTWSIRDDELVLRYVIEQRGAADLLGLSFDFPEAQVTAKRWVGTGPYRIWKNRDAGVTYGLHEVAYSRAVPGESFFYPEFHGFFGAWEWLELLGSHDIAVRNLSGVPYFGLYTPPGGEKPILELPQLGLTFLHAIPAIGTKFALPELLGPDSQPTQIDGEIRGEIAFVIAPGHVR